MHHIKCFAQLSLQKHLILLITLIFDWMEGKMEEKYWSFEVTSECLHIHIHAAIHLKYKCVRLYAYTSVWRENTITIHAHINWRHELLSSTAASCFSLQTFYFSAVFLLFFTVPWHLQNYSLLFLITAGLKEKRKSKIKYCFIEIWWFTYPRWDIWWGSINFRQI